MSAPALKVVGGAAMDRARVLCIEAALGEAIEYLAFVNPTMAALVRTVAQRAGHGVPAMAWATRTACHYSDTYALQPVKVRAGVSLHEYAHVALGHHGRAQRIARRRDGFDARLFNIAADLVINTWIERIAQANRNALALPAGVVLASSLASQFAAEGIDLSGSATAGRLAIHSFHALAERSTETVHAVLRDLARKGGRGEAAVDLLMPEGAGDVVVGADPDESDGDEEGTRRQVVRSLTTMAGTDRWDFASDLLVAIPRPRIDWRRQMRSLVLREQGGEVETTWGRVSRRQPSFGAVRMPGSRRGETGHAVAVFDTSASIDDEVIRGFMAEAGAIANLTGNPVAVLEADVGVQRVSAIAPGGPPHQVMRDKGRGGTDFTEALREADALAPSVIVYLTDLQAPEPRYRPRAPVIWCAVGEQAGPGFGRIVRIPGD